jgi:hypothetical protein
MLRDNRLWLLFAGLAIALSVACSSSSTPGGPSGEDGSPAGPGGQDATETVADSMTQG